MHRCSSKGARLSVRRARALSEQDGGKCRTPRRGAMLGCPGRSEARCRSIDPAIRGTSMESPLQSVTNAFDVIGILAREPDLTLTDIAGRLRTSKTATHRLLATLQKNG